MGHIVWLLTTAAAFTGSLFQQLHAIEMAASVHQSDVRFHTQKQGCFHISTWTLPLWKSHQMLFLGTSGSKTKHFNVPDIGVIIKWMMAFEGMMCLVWFMLTRRHNGTWEIMWFYMCASGLNMKGFIGWVSLSQFGDNVLIWYEIVMNDTFIYCRKRLVHTKHDIDEVLKIILDEKE